MTEALREVIEPRSLGRRQRFQWHSGGGGDGGGGQQNLVERVEVGALALDQTVASLHHAQDIDFTRTELFFESPQFDGKFAAGSVTRFDQHLSGTFVAVCGGLSFETRARDELLPRDGALRQLRTCPTDADRIA